jgi:hypothetical protein
MRPTRLKKRLWTLELLSRDRREGVRRRWWMSLLDVGRTFSHALGMSESAFQWSKWMDRSTTDVDIPDRMFDMLKVIHLRR